MGPVSLPTAGNYLTLEEIIRRNAWQMIHRKLFFRSSLFPHVLFTSFIHFFVCFLHVPLLYLFPRFLCCFNFLFLRVLRIVPFFALFDFLVFSLFFSLFSFFSCPLLRGLGLFEATQFIFALKPHFFPARNVGHFGQLGMKKQTRPWITAVNFLPRKPGGISRLGVGRRYVGG